MIAYELAIETGIAVSATVTAGTTTTLSAARLALLAQKLKRLERYADRIDDLLKVDGKLVAKLRELFSELKAHGKIDASKHLDLLKIKCFSRDTLVHTATGPRPIGEIEPGEQIWSYHFERGVWGLCEVKERLDNTYSGPVISITVDNTTIEATAYQPFWVLEGRDLLERSKPRELLEHEDEGHSLPGRWVNSHELRAGDCIITRSGTRALITEIRQRFDDAFPVSNLSIIGHHNYAVGDVGVLVHNESVCDETIADLRELHGDGKSDDEIRNWLRSQTDSDGNRLYDDSEIDDAMEEILAPHSKFRGGPHRRTKFPKGDGKDSNHSPADAISPFRRDDGPAFQMDPDDHKEMSSTGNSRRAKAWRKKQQDLIDQGMLREAVQMDIDEARRLFGSKYDEAIEEMLDYITSIGY
jgi:hypothetical protein